MDESQLGAAELLAEVQRLRRRLADLESEQEDSRAMLQALVGSIPDIIYRLDRDGRILYISDAVRRYGYEPDRLIGTSIMDLIHPEDRERRRSWAHRASPATARLACGRRKPCARLRICASSPPRPVPLRMRSTSR